MEINNILIIVLLSIVLISIGFNIYLILERDNLILERDNLNNRFSALNSRIETIDSKVRTYLEAEGRTCDKDIEICLDELTKILQTKTGPDCSSVPDGFCPDWCSAGSDYDCCIDKGYKWVQGRGCYPE